MTNPRWTNEMVAGWLPYFLDDADPSGAVDQIKKHYVGGWYDFPGFRLGGNWRLPGQAKLLYPGDPAMQEMSRAQLREETVVLFEGEWVAVIQPDGKFRAARCD